MILSYLKFTEAVSGTELIGSIGPGYGETKLKNNTINKRHTDVFDTDLGLITWDQYQEYINIYLKSGGIINDLTGNIENDIFYIKSKMEDNNI